MATHYPDGRRGMEAIITEENIDISDLKCPPVDCNSF